MKLKKGTFSIFPVAMCYGLHPYQQVLMAWLFKHANDDGICWPSLNLLAQECGISRDSVVRHIKILEEKGYLAKERRKNKNDWASTEYKVVIMDSEVVAESDNPLSDTATTLVAESDKGVVAESDTNYNHIQLNPKTKSKTYIHAEKSLDDNFSEEFENTWSYYPERGGSNNKLTAFSCWKKRIAEGVKAEDMLIATKNYQILMNNNGSIGTTYVMQGQRFYGIHKEYEQFINMKPEELTNATNRQASQQGSKQSTKQRISDRINRDYEMAWGANNDFSSQDS